MTAAPLHHSQWLAKASLYFLRALFNFEWLLMKAQLQDFTAVSAFSSWFIANRTSCNLHRDASAWILCWSFLWTSHLPGKERVIENRTSEGQSRTGYLEVPLVAVHFSAASFEHGCTFLFVAIVSSWVTEAFICLPRLPRHFYLALPSIIVNAGQCIFS